MGTEAVMLLSFNSGGWREVAMRGYDQYTLYKGMKCLNNKKTLLIKKKVLEWKAAHTPLNSTFKNS